MRASVLVLALAAGAVAQTPREAFTVVALPDTQKYSEKYPEIFVAQTTWTVGLRDRENVVFVTHLGDLVEHFDRRSEWEVADRAMRVLDGVLPYSACFGNHDIGSALNTNFFGPGRYAGREGYLGASPNGLNHAQLFQGGGYRFLHLNLEYGAREPAFAWARGVLAAHPDGPVILSTHDNMGLAGRTPNGEAIWSGFIARTPRIFLVLNGHTHGEYWQVSERPGSTRVIEVLSDYQDNRNGGDGDLRILRFLPARNRLEIETYSPTLDRSPAGASSRFGFDVTFGDALVVTEAAGRFARTGIAAQEARLAPSAKVEPLAETPPAPGVTRLRFRQGMGGYTGMVATEVRQQEPATAKAHAASLGVDRDDPPGSGMQSQVLLRFDGLTGAGSNAIPSGTAVVSARLKLFGTDEGSGFALHRALRAWDATSTWASVVDGLAADGDEAVATADCVVGADDAKANVAKGWLTLDVTAAVQSWAAGTPNRGWVLLPRPAGTNGVDFDGAAAPEADHRPELVVDIR